MTTYVRGSMVYFSAAFVDKAGAPVTPDSAAVSLVYRNAADGAGQKATVTLAITGNVAEGAWDSAVAAPGVVHWSVRGKGANAIVQDGTLTLTANEANQ